MKRFKTTAKDVHLKMVTVLRVTKPVDKRSKESKDREEENSSWKEATQEEDAGSLQERERLPFHPGKAVSQ